MKDISLEQLAKYKKEYLKGELIASSIILLLLVGGTHLLKEKVFI